MKKFSLFAFLTIPALGGTAQERKAEPILKESEKLEITQPIELKVKMTPQEAQQKSATSTVISPAPAKKEEGIEPLKEQPK
jgi:hypothetical protein